MFKIEDICKVIAFSRRDDDREQKFKECLWEKFI